MQLLLRAAVLASDARLINRDNRWTIDGDATEGALLVAANKAGLDPAGLTSDEPRVAEIPFTSDRRRMTTLHGTAPRARRLLEGRRRRHHRRLQPSGACRR